MNTMDDEQRLIDRLVDGALAPADRCALLARFENQPDGWRRCALAFLEAQTWREVLAPHQEEAASEDRSSPPALSIRPRRAFRAPGARRWRSLAAVAAGWLAAFATGWFTAGSPSESNPRTPPLTARAPTLSRPEHKTSSPAPRRPVVGIVEVPILDDRRFPELTSPLPESIRRRLEHQGFQVEPRRGLVSAKLKNGRHVAIPVDALKVRYVGDRTL